MAVQIQGGKRKVPVVVFMTQEEIETTLEVVESVNCETIRPMYEALLSALGLAQSLNKSGVNLGRCRYCHAQIVWIDRKPYDALPPESPNTTRRFEFKPHLSSCPKAPERPRDPQ